MLLCWLPNKFSKVVWAQRGDFLIVSPSAPEEGETKITATIVHILFPEQVTIPRDAPFPVPTSSADAACLLKLVFSLHSVMHLRTPNPNPQTTAL